jgi:hypothetical protein
MELPPPNNMIFRNAEIFKKKKKSFKERNVVKENKESPGIFHFLACNLHNRI